MIIIQFTYNQFIDERRCAYDMVNVNLITAKLLQHLNAVFLPVSYTHLQHPVIEEKDVNTFDPMRYVSAYDQEEGDLTSKITKAGEVKNKAGSYAKMCIRDR